MKKKWKRKKTKSHSWCYPVNRHIFLKKKMALSLRILNFSCPCILIREPLGRHSSHWRCEIVRVGSSRMSLASKQIPRSKMLSLASLVSALRVLMNFSRASPCWKFSGLLTTNRRVPLRRTDGEFWTNLVLWKFFKIFIAYTSRLELSDITREFPREIPSWGDPRNVVVVDDGRRRRYSVISVVWRSKEEFWEFPAKHPDSERVLGEIIACWSFKEQPGVPLINPLFFCALFFLLLFFYYF